MKKFMFGLDKENAFESAKKLRRDGYDAVVTNEGAREAKSAGLEVWECFGAFSLDADAPAGHRAVLYDGSDGTWFGSGCPCCDELAGRNMARALDRAVRDGAAGLFVDGARFASFASSEGTERFLGCFCDRCMAKMRAYGIDADEVREGIRLFVKLLKEDETGDIERIRNAIDSMLTFRGRVIGEYMEHFSVACHARGLKSGAFVFAPSLGWAVGQGLDGIRGIDVISPMVYRAWPANENGPATLSHEWNGFMKLLGQQDRKPEQLASILFGMGLFNEEPLDGFSVEHVSFEAEASRNIAPKESLVVPILQADDGQLDECAQAALKAGCDGYGEFCWSRKK